MTTTTTAPATNYRVRFSLDPDGQFEESNGESRPMTADEYRDNEYMHEGQVVPYEEYRRYYGNPDRHVFVASEVEQQCPCCGAWTWAGGTCGIDFMDDAQELLHLDTWFTPVQILERETALGYLYDIAMDDLRDAGWTAPDTIYCAHEGCTYRHVAGQRFCANHGKGKE